MLNSDTEPTALSEVGLESCLSISEDLTGHLSLGEIENAEQYDIYLERSDRTTSYLAYIDGETNGNHRLPAIERRQRLANADDYGL